MRLRTKIGAAMAAVTLTGAVTTGLFTTVRVTRTIHEEAERRLLEATGTLGGEWRAIGSRVSAGVAEVAQSRSLKTELALLARGAIPAESREIISLAKRVKDRTELDFLQIFDEQGTVISNGHWQIFYGRPDSTGWEITKRQESGPVAHWRQVQGQRFLAVETSARMEAGDRVYQIVGGHSITPEMVEEIGRRTGGALYIQTTDGSRIIPPGVVPQDVQHLARPRLAEYGGASFMVGAPPTGEAAGISLFPIQRPGGTVLGEFVLRISQARLNELAAELARTFLWIGAIGVVAAGLLGYWMARRITRPVEELAVAAGRVGVGRSPGPMPRITADEVGDLIRSFSQMTADLAESRRELVRAERIGAWREIAQHLAHEIKNALSPIQISVETIQRSRRTERPDFDEILAEAVRTVRDEVEGLRNLVNEFSQFARMPELHLVPGAVGAVVERAALLHDMNPGGIRVRRILATDLPPVALDAEALSRAVGNVVLNAVEASPPGGEVTITTDRTAENGVQILVDDQGPGVPVEAREKVFDPYYTTKEGGTGLGLAMAYKIVAEHGGRIEIGDRPGGGGRFRILLPALGTDGAMRAGT